MIGNDPYFSRDEVSNSDLTELELALMPEDRRAYVKAVFRFGSLVDAMITEPARCNHHNNTVDGVPFSKWEWQTAYRMLNAFRSDEQCADYLKLAETQRVFLRPHMPLEYKGIHFSLGMRCKYDLWMKALGYGADIKTTTCATQAAFETSIPRFNYDRQRYMYMLLSGSPKDMIIGISKTNFKIFKVAIVKGDAIYNAGMAKHSELSFKWWSLYGSGNKQVDYNQMAKVEEQEKQLKSFVELAQLRP